MKCEKCGKEIAEGDNKICDDCKKELLNELSSEENVKNIDNNKKTEDNQKEKSSKFRKLLIYILIFLVIVVLLAVLKFNNIMDSFIVNKVGNSIANIRNYGYTTSQGAWIYYVAPTEDGKEIAIYKARENGDDKQVLVKDDWDVLGLNVKNDYLYFIALTDEPIESSSTLSSNESVDTLNNKIYRMKTDGTGLEVINSNEFHNNCYELYVVNDKIYYIGVDQNIYYMNLDGTDKNKLNDDETGYLGITDKYIVLNIKKEPKEDTSSKDENETKNGDEENTTDTSTQKFETCVMNLDGSDLHSLTGERLYSINIVGDYIYYVDDQKNINKVKFDGSDKTLISDKVSAYNMNVSKDYIFFMSYVDESADKVSIYRMDLNGENCKEIYSLSNYSSFLNVVNGKVIFMDSDNTEGTINMIDEEGNNRVKLYSYSSKVGSSTNDSNETSDENTSTENTNETTSDESVNKTETNETNTEQ